LFNSQSVAALIFRVSGMALYPVECDLVLFKQRQQPLPEVNVQRRLFVGLYPVLFLPAIDPAFCNAVYNISAVGGEYHLTGFFQSLQSGNDSQELHAVIGSVCIAAGKLLFGLSIAEHNTVSAGAGVAAAGAVSKNLNSLDKIHSFIR